MLNKAVYETESNIVFIVNLMNLSQVPVYNVKQINGICRFTVKGKYVAEAERVLAEHGKVYSKIRDDTAKEFMRRNVTRFGIYAGILLIAVFAFLWARVVTEVEISGTSRISEEEIMRAVEELTDLPAEKKNINLDELEKKIVAINGVSNVSLDIKGNIVFIDILEELPYPDVVDYNEKTPVKSKYDAIITRIVTYSGTAAAEVGDTVKKGDTLILPQRVAEDGTTTEIKAMGDVYGRIWISEQYVFTPNVIVNERTGRKKTYFIAASSENSPKPPYDCYEREESVIINPLFPVKLRKITYYETEAKTRKFDYEKERERLIEEKTADLEKKIPEGAEKVRNWFSEKTVDKNAVLVIYYEIIVKLND